ncbi:MAG: NAD-dependent epimerase/dehydratase family protein, partial [Deltaproteobacteria bacterium]
LCKMLLEEGCSVVAVDNLMAGTLENLPQGVDFKKVDVCDSDFARYVEGANAVFHLAARNCLDDCAKNPVDTARINVMGTANVLQACVDYKVPHVIYSDTSAEYEGIEEFPSKVDQVKPMSIYACSKRGGSLIAEGFRNYYGLNVSTVRYFNVYGPAQDWRRVIPPVMSAFTIKLLQGQQPFIYGTGEKRRDFIHVDDINRFHLKLLREKAIQGGIYNLGSGKDYPILEIFNKIEAEIRSGLKPMFKPELPGEAFRTMADITETCKTGWSPQVSIEDGIKSFVEYTRERLSRG